MHLIKKAVSYYITQEDSLPDGLTYSRLKGGSYQLDAIVEYKIGTSDSHLQYQLRRHMKLRDMFLQTHGTTGKMLSEKILHMKLKSFRVSDNFSFMYVIPRDASLKILNQMAEFCPSLTIERFPQTRAEIEERVRRIKYGEQVTAP